MLHRTSIESLLHGEQDDVKSEVLELRGKPNVG